MTTDWSQICSDILYQVAQTFESPEDLIHFSTVCQDWNELFPILKSKWSPSIPWIMLPEPGEDRVKIHRRLCLRKPSVNMNLIVDNKHHPHTENPECFRSLFDPLSSKLYQLKLPELCGCKCFCSPCGWILAIGLDLKVRLFNPLTKSQLHLPPLWTMPDAHVFDASEFQRVWSRTIFIQKGFVFKVPYEDGEGLIAMVVDCDSGSLTFARPGDYAWTPVDFGARIHDVVYWKDKFLILRGLKLFYFDYADTLNPGSVVVPKKFHCYPRQHFRDFFKACRHELYLLEAHGDLYMIFRNRIQVDEEVDKADGHNTVSGKSKEKKDRDGGNCSLQVEEDDSEDNNHMVQIDSDNYIVHLESDNESSDGDEYFWSYKTLSLRVFKLIVDCEKWEEVFDVGSMAMFVGNGNSTHAYVYNTNWPPPSSIAFMDDEHDFWGYTKRRGGGHDTGLYDMKTKKLINLYLGDDMYSRFCVPLYFKPSLLV